MAWADDDPTVTITISSFTNLPSGNAAYATYDWTADGVSGKGQIFANQSSTRMQMNGGNANGKILYNTTAVPGSIKKINIKKESGSNRSYSVYGRTTAYTGTGDYGTLIATANIADGNGRDYTVTSGDYEYFVVVHGSSNVAYLASITVTYEASITKHTLSSAVSPSGVGTVTLGATEVGEGKSTTIEATVTNSAYRFKNWTKTSGTIEDENAASTTFTMGTSDATVTANFELIPTHTVTVTPTNDGTITVKKGNDVVSSGAEVPEGTELTIIAEAGEGKEFDSWSVTGAEPASTTDAETTLTVGENNITIAASFNSVTTHKISWSVNGIVVKEENIKEGNAITFAAPESGIPTGYAYTGWTEAELSGVSDTAPTYITEATSTADKTYYAVLAVANGTTGTVTLTANWETSNSSYTDHEYTDDNNNTWTGFNNENKYSGTCFFSFKADKVNNKYTYIKSPKFPGNVTEIKMKTYNGGTSARTIYINSEAGKSGDYGSISMPGGEKLTTEHTVTLVENASFDEFYIGTDTGTNGFSYCTVTYGSSSFSDFCTTIPPVTANITAAGYATFSSFTNVDFSANEDLTVFTAKQNGTSITLTEVDSKKVPANTAVILKGEGGNFDGTVVATADALENNDLQIAEEDMNGSSGKIYVLNKVDGVVGFYKLSANGTLTKGKAYLEAESEAPYFGFDGEGTTGIQSIERTINDNQYYTLDGRRVAEPTKGLYIINGKKVVIK